MIPTFHVQRSCRNSLLALALGASSAVAAPGDLDLSFGQDGVMLVSRGGGAEHFSAALTLPDGSVLAAGALYHRDPAQAPTRGYDMSLVKVRPDGQLDPDWGIDGLAQIDNGQDGDAAFALARQPDGKLLVAGRIESGAYSDFGLARLHPDGSLDQGFGEILGDARRGFVRINIGPGPFFNDEARAVALQSDGRIVLAGIGFAQDGGFNYQRFALARFSAQGELDVSFGDAGTVIAPATQFQVAEYLTGIATRRDGSLPGDAITVVGYVFARSTGLIRRYLPDGQPDLNFGENGTLRLTETVQNGVRRGMTSVAAAAWQDDGKLVVVGTGGDRGFVFQRFHADGTLDTGFGQQGRTLVKFSPTVEYDEPAALVLQPNGKILAAGYASMRYGEAARSKDFAVVRLLPDGSPDPQFGDGQGRSTYPLSIGTDEAFAIAVDGTGQLLVAGAAIEDGHQGGGGSRRGAFLRLHGDADLFRSGFE